MRRAGVCEPPFIREWRSINMRRSSLAILGSLSIIGLLLASPGCEQKNEPSAADQADQANQAAADWCAEHGLPESQCDLCNPRPSGGVRSMADLARGARPAPREEPQCGEHRVPSALCAICLPTLEPWLEDSEEAAATHRGPLLRLATTEAARKAGLRAVPAALPPEQHTVEAVAQVVYDEDRFSRVSVPIAGTVEKVFVDLGDEIEAGRPLALLRSAEIARMRSEIVVAEQKEELARVDLDRATALHDQGLVSDRDILAHRQEWEIAKAERIAAERRLRAIGRGAMSAESTESDLLRIVAPQDGRVVTRAVVPGQVVDAEETLLEVADMQRMWAELDVVEQEAGLVRSGQEVSLSVHALPGLTFEGTVIAVSGSLDPGNRRLRVRAVVDNPSGLLKAGAYGEARISVGRTPAVALVPVQAVQYVEDRPCLFVRLEEDLFETRPIRTGGVRGERVEILSGIEPHEEVVTDASFLLKTQISKGSIGAGCCDVVETLGK
ncbi:MAG: efflux RND transporter periplasmic adaptor subunit [Candidatus Eisenbacteria bacterium]|nr:efflux RND transporter periplasmic adaptor subunit [Candidatus Latescibacterota bacterium]MBD3302120.1 efflux RND transporter periplasmic adaptor subunit [Candidatus Eisenbacteria bacterium]